MKYRKSIRQILQDYFDKQKMISTSDIKDYENTKEILEQLQAQYLGLC